MKVVQVGEESFSSVWKHLKRAVDHSHGRWDEDSVRQAVRQGYQQLWVAVEDGVVVGAATTQVITYPKRRTLFIQFLGGEDFQAWMRPGLEQLTKYAKVRECDSIETFGRRGFKKVLPTVGFVPTYTVFEKEVI